MADRYWVGGTANWDGTAGFKWATTSGGAGGASVPTTSDNVYFDANSGGAGVVVTIVAGNGGALQIDATNFVGIIAGTAPITIKKTLRLYINLNWLYSGNITLGSNGNAGELYPAGKTISSLTINTGTIVAGVTLYGSLTVGTLTLTSGFFDANNGYTVVITNSFQSSNSNNRILYLTNNTIQLSGSGVVWNCATSTNLGIYLNGTNYIYLGTSGLTSAQTFAGCGKPHGRLWFLGTNAVTITGSNTFETIQSISTPTSVSFEAGSTQTVTNFLVSGTSGNTITIDSTVSGTQATLSKSSGTVSSSYLSLKDNNATGGATWTATNSTIVTNVTGWNILSPASGSAFMQFF